MTISRAKLEELINPMVERCRGPLIERPEGRQADPGATSTRSSWSAVRRGCRSCRRFVENMVGKKIQRGMDPMECVAMGAAIQGAVLSGEVKDVLLLDVTPLSLGHRDAGRHRHQAHRAQHHHPHQEVADILHRGGQPASVEIHVLQGERDMAADNVSLGRFQLTGIPARAEGRAADRGHVRHRRQRHHQRQRQGPRHRQGAEDHHHRRPTSCPRTRSSKWSRRPSSSPRRTRSAGRRSRPSTRRTRSIYTTEKTLHELGDKVPPRRGRRWRRPSSELKDEP